MPSRPVRRSPLAMVVLALLEEAPMHAYRMQQLIRERAKDTVVNVGSRNSIYQVLDRLSRSELIDVRETSRDERRPERTVYQITPAGREALYEWLGSMLGRPQKEYPSFPAALAFVALLTPDQLAAQLAARADALRRQLAELDPAAVAEEYNLLRVFVLEDEYMRAMVEAELAWVQSVLEDLRTGALSWSVPELRQWSESLGP